MACTVHVLVVTPIFTHCLSLSLQILDAYEGTMEGGPAPSEVYEHSEMLQYKAQVLLEGGSLPAALAALDRCKVLSAAAVPCAGVVLVIMSPGLPPT